MSESSRSVRPRSAGVKRRPGRARATPCGTIPCTTRALIDLAIVAIIPARFGSTRLAGKPLADIHGKTDDAARVHERAARAELVDRVLVATDDERIAARRARLRRRGGADLARATRRGTDRLAEAARGTDAEIVVERAGRRADAGPARSSTPSCSALLDDPSLPMSTLSLPLRRLEEMLSPCGGEGRRRMHAATRSTSRAAPSPTCATEDRADPSRRAARPLARGPRPQARRALRVPPRRAAALRRATAGPLEQAEALEQLRALAPRHAASGSCRREGRVRTWPSIPRKTWSACGRCSGLGQLREIEGTACRPNTSS